MVETTVRGMTVLYAACRLVGAALLGQVPVGHLDLLWHCFVIPLHV